MNLSLVEASAALRASAQWQDLIAENLASSSIPGYKKQETSFSAIAAGVMPTAGAGGPNAASRFSLAHVGQSTNFQNGELRFTGVNTDLALENNGFFALQMPDGKVAYTRDGEFQLNAQGQLVSKQGYLVLGDSGPIQFDFNNRDAIAIAPTGEISQGASRKGRLKIVDFNDPHKLRPIGGGNFLASDPGLMTKDAAGVNVRQGFLESANTSPAAEMAHLITAMRMYETNQRIVQMQDDRMGKEVAELGSPN